MEESGIWNLESGILNVGVGNLESGMWESRILNKGICEYQRIRIAEN